MAAIKGERTLAELAQQFDVHPNPITEWKRQLQERAADVFGASGTASSEPQVVQCCLCSRNPPRPKARRRLWPDPEL
jgi:transposase-like protein